MSSGLLALSGRGATGGRISRHLPSLRPAGTPVPDVEYGGQAHPEPVKPLQAAGLPKEHVDQRREGEEDETQQRPDPGVEGGVHQLRPGHPDDEQCQTGEDAAQQYEQAPHGASSRGVLAGPCPREPLASSLAAGDSEDDPDLRGQPDALCARACRNKASESASPLCPALGVRACTVSAAPVPDEPALAQRPARSPPAVGSGDPRRARDASVGSGADLDSSVSTRPSWMTAVTSKSRRTSRTSPPNGPRCTTSW